MIDLIYTSGNNRQYAQLALDAGWLVGVRSDKHAYDECFPIRFVDIKYRLPDYARHLALTQRVRPRYAVVPDLNECVTTQEDIQRALQQAEQLARFCDIPLVVPKRIEQLALLPQDTAIGFSVQSAYGGFAVSLLDELTRTGLQNRRIHLLGGSPHRQMDIFLHLSHIARIVSADGNMAQRMSAVQKYWLRGKWVLHPQARRGKSSVTTECIAWSLENIRRAWEEIA
jgi:hypothetical protein